MAKKWRTSIRKLLHKNKSPNEQQVRPTQETGHISSKESQRDEKLRWESFENKLAERMGSAVKKKNAHEEIGVKIEGTKSLFLQEIRGRSVIDEDLGPFSDNVVGKKVLTSTVDDEDITCLINTPSIRLNETGKIKKFSKKSLAKATMRKPPASDSVSLKSSARSESTGLKSTSDDNDITCLISTSSDLLKESGLSDVVSLNNPAKIVMEKPPQSDFVSLESFARSASSETKASTRKRPESDSASLTSFARSANNTWKVVVNKAFDSDLVSLKSPAGSTSSTTMAATKQPSKSNSAIRESPTRSHNNTRKAFANKTLESSSVTGKLRARWASSSAMAVTRRPSKSDFVSLMSASKNRRSLAIPAMERPSEVVSETLPSTKRRTIITVTGVRDKPFTSSSSSSLKSPTGSASTTSSETTSSKNDSPSIDTDPISFRNTEFSGSHLRERLQSFLDDDASSYTRERLHQSFLEEDESSLVTGTYTYATLDNESITGGILERTVLMVGLWFLCNLMEDDG